MSHPRCWAPAEGDFARALPHMKLAMARGSIFTGDLWYLWWLVCLGHLMAVHATRRSVGGGEPAPHGADPLVHACRVTQGFGFGVTATPGSFSAVQ